MSEQAADELAVKLDIMTLLDNSIKRGHIPSIDDDFKYVFTVDNIYEELISGSEVYKNLDYWSKIEYAIIKIVA